MLTARQIGELRRTKPAGRNRLALAMEMAEVTQVQLAEAVGLTQPRISLICAGRYGDGGLPIETARDLARFFGCSIEDIFPPTKPAAVAS